MISSLRYFSMVKNSYTMATSGLLNDNCPRESGQLSTIIPQNHGITTRNVLLSAQMGERASVVLICNIASHYNEVK